MGEAKQEAQGGDPKIKVSRKELRASVDGAVRSSPGGPRLPVLPGLYGTTKRRDQLRDMVFLVTLKDEKLGILAFTYIFLHLTLYAFIFLLNSILGSVKDAVKKRTQCLFSRILLWPGLVMIFIVIIIITMTTTTIRAESFMI